MDEKQFLNGSGPGSKAESDFMRRYSFSDLIASGDSERRKGESVADGTHVIIKRTPKHNPFLVDSARREIAALSVIRDSSIPTLREWIESETSIWTVFSANPSRTIRQSIESYGSLSEPELKSTVSQLFSGLACIFAEGFSHLRISNETVFLNDQLELMISDFEHAHEYGHERTTDGLYAAVSDKYGDDIFVAPEVFASVKYNARKAALWSCGVLVYYMTTGQTEKLSTLDHPAFEGHVAASSQHESSLRRASQPVSSSRRKLSSASQSAFNAPLISYPQNRLAVPSWTRDIISKMLAPDPLRRAELIEVASKVPKELLMRDTRPLMELAWLDYKNHVGPLAGLSDGNGSGDAASAFSFSRMSAWSRESLGGLLPGRGRVKVSEIGGAGDRRRKSMWR